MRSFNFVPICSYLSVWKIFLRITTLSSVLALRNSLNSPCAIIAICLNCCNVRWRISLTIYSLAFFNVVIGGISALSKFSTTFWASAFFSNSPFLLCVMRGCSGSRSIVYCCPLWVKVKVTSDFALSGIKLQRRNLLSRLFPLASPKRAKQIASKMEVLPAPVSPVIRKIPLSPKWEKSISFFSA